MNDHSGVWWAGYQSAASKTANPYKLRPQMYGKDAEKLAKEWQAGWEARFFGEGPAQDKVDYSNV